MGNSARKHLTHPYLIPAVALTIVGLLAQNADAISFQQVNGPFAEAEAWGSSWGDFNNDRCPDLFVNHHRDEAALYKNNCDGTFKDVSRKVDVDRAWLDDNRFSDQHGVAWADFDGDGDQDMYITSGARWDGALLINENGVLRNRTADSGIQDDREGRMPLWVDYDNDRLLDLFMQSRTRTWSLNQNHNNIRFFDSSSSTGFSIGSTVDFGLLTDLNNDGTPEYLGVPEGNFPQVAYDMSSLPFRNITNKITRVPLTLDATIADFNGDQLNDVLLVRGRIRRSQSKQFGNNWVESWFTASAGNPDKKVRFRSQGGDLQVDMHSFLGLVRYHFGSKGYHPTESTRRNSTFYRFDLDASDSRNHGIKPHSATAPNDLGVYIGYHPSSQEWEVNLANGGQYTTAYFVIRSSAPISNLEVVGLSNIDLPISPVILLNNGTGFNGNSSPLSMATQIGDLNTPVRCNGVAAGDFDNDMDQDVYMVCSGGVENIENILYENRGDGRFDRVNNAGGAEGPVGSSVMDGHSIADNVTVADYDGDGKLDLFVTNGVQLFPVRFDSPDQLYRNTTRNNNRWIELDLIGTRSNADGIGAKVYASAGGVTQLREQYSGHHRWAQNHQRLHFGLGNNSTVNLRIEWPSGIVDTYNNVSANRLYQVREDRNLTPTQLGPVASDPGGNGGNGGGGNNGGMDTVEVVRAVYLANDNAVWVRATSDLQPLSSATLTVIATTNGNNQQLGSLNWNSTQNAYQNNFKNVNTPPDCVTVTSANGGTASLPLEGSGSCDGSTPTDPTSGSLTVDKAIYFESDDRLWVRADSDATPQGSANIEATLVYGSSEVPLGAVGWKSAVGHYQHQFNNVTPTPDSIIITNDGGDSATADVVVQ